MAQRAGGRDFQSWKVALLAADAPRLFDSQRHIDRDGLWLWRQASDLPRRDYAFYWRASGVVVHWHAALQRFERCADEQRRFRARFRDVDFRDRALLFFVVDSRPHMGAQSARG